MAGRKPKLTQELIKDANDLIKLGNYTRTVCQYLGVTESAWYSWLREGEEASESDRKSKGLTALKMEFFHTIKKAEAHAEIRNVKLIQSAGQDNWQAAAWYLERKFHDRWGRKESIAADINHGGEIKNNVDLSGLSVDDLKRIAKGEENQ